MLLLSMWTMPHQPSLLLLLPLLMWWWQISRCSLRQSR
jgi:hypothetical protein